MNTWPNGVRRALSQSDHNDWNNSNYPGTRQLCYKCDGPTGRCEEDSMNDDDGNPHCIDCFQVIKFARLEWDYAKRVVYFENIVYINNDFGELIPVEPKDVILIYTSLQD